MVVTEERITKRERNNHARNCRGGGGCHATVSPSGMATPQGHSRITSVGGAERLLDIFAEFV